MFNIANLPAVRAQLERDVAEATEQGAAAPATEEVAYARAPAAAGPQPTGSRPAAMQGQR